MGKEVTPPKSNFQFTISISEALLLLTFLLGVGASTYSLITALPELKEDTKAVSQLGTEIKVQDKSIDELQERTTIFEARITKTEDRLRDLELSLSGSGIKVTAH